QLHPARRWQQTAPSPLDRAVSAAQVRRCFGEGIGRTRSKGSKGSPSQETLRTAPAVGQVRESSSRFFRGFLRGYRVPDLGCVGVVGPTRARTRVPDSTRLLLHAPRGFSS